MLTQLFASNRFVGFLFSIVIILQIGILSTQQLFGDEAFYWLESQFMALSYAELPGWTAWMIRLGTEIFGNNYFGVRIISYLGYLSIFPCIWLLHNKLSKPNQAVSLILLIPLAIPIYVLIAVMALPDVWLLIFVIWIVYFFSKACTSNSKKYWVLVGLLLALSLNIHVRMWIWLFIAGLVFLFVYRQQQKIITSAILITFPIAMLGLIPVILFNYHNEFVLFKFQFSQRHPWEFQLQNLNFIISQLFIVSPLVLLLWFNNVLKTSKITENVLIVNWIVFTAVIHWMLYAILGLFADGVRTTVHWVLISYLPVLVLSTLFIKREKRLMWVVLSGFVMTLIMLVFLITNKNTSSNAQARIFDNSSGWQQLSNQVSLTQEQHGIDNIITDYFMTAAELAFELNQTDPIKVLSHPKNIKHGREKQLEIMGLLLKIPQSYKEEALLIVEDSTLKLQEKGLYYTQLCENFDSLELIKSLNINNTGKLFHLFKVNHGGNHCEIPPLFYTDFKKTGDSISISGWAILHDSEIQKLNLKSGNRNIVVINNRIKNMGVKQQFPEISDSNLPNVGFEINVFLHHITNNKFQLEAIGNNNKSYLSQTYYLD